ncbi:serine hydrolase [Pseudotamlana agarivorans]|uniref:serine hydrolase n=1 Tax=Pseudotamlana agarivorans TaxID=481183 RepID=UPI00082B1510|nr:serine hydrolase [Tamlana agarivorans]
MNKKFTFLVLVLLLGLLPQVSTSQVSDKEIDAIVKKSMDNFTVAGASIAVVKDGKIIIQKGYGVTSIETHQKVDKNTIFGIASNTKAFTAAALAILVDEGKLTWNDPVIKHIPEFKMYNAYATNNFNIIDLITHRSGLAEGAGDLMLMPTGSDFTMNDVLTNYQYFKPVSAFRTEAAYNTVLFLVAREIITRISGISYGAFIQKRILEPLNMNNSCYGYSKTLNKPNVSKFHISKENKLNIEETPNWDNKKVKDALEFDFVYSNAHDMTSWMLLHLNKGKYGPDLKQQLFSEKNLQEIWKIHTVITQSKNPRYHSNFSGVGLGWGLKDINGHLQASHIGGFMENRITLIPDLNLGIMVLTNTSFDGYGLINAVTQSILDKYLGLDEFDWIKTYKDWLNFDNTEADAVVDKVWATIKTTDTKHLDLKNYIGSYKDPWLGTVEISNKENKLWFESLRSPKLSGPMYFYKANTFAVKWTDFGMPDTDAFVMFQLDEEGKAIGFKMKGISPITVPSNNYPDLDFTKMKDN